MNDKARQNRNEMTEFTTTATEPIPAPRFVYVKYATTGGDLQIARHMRPALLGPGEDISDFVRDLVHTYKSNRSVKYLGIADEDEFAAFRTLNDRRR
jgi:hypothetical protein